MFDRLNALGITMSYSTSLNILYNLSSCTHQRLISEIKEGKCVRLVGDNLNLKIGTKNERSSRQGKMINYFASKSISLWFQSVNSNASFTHEQASIRPSSK